MNYEILCSNDEYIISLVVCSIKNEYNIPNR